MMVSTVFGAAVSCQKRVTVLVIVVVPLSPSRASCRRSSDLLLPYHCRVSFHMSVVVRHRELFCPKWTTRPGQTAVVPWGPAWRLSRQNEPLGDAHYPPLPGPVSRAVQLSRLPPSAFWQAGGREVGRFTPK